MTVDDQPPPAATVDGLPPSVDAGSSPDAAASADSLAALVAAMPFAGVLGVELTRAGADEVVARMAHRPELTTVGGVLHGGAQMALADTVGAVCAFYNLPPGATTATIESKTNLFRAVTSGALVATARPLHVGRSTIVVQTDLTDDRDRRIAQVTQTQAVIRPEAR